MSIRFGREICNDADAAEGREWLVTNGIGGYASGTVAGSLTRRYHGLLIAAIQPPIGRTLLLSKLDETLTYRNSSYALFTNRWPNCLDPNGYINIESFRLYGNIPTWSYACGDALLVKQIWMQQGQNTAYIRYKLVRATAPVNLRLKALVNYRNHHHDTVDEPDFQIIVESADKIKIVASENATPFYLSSQEAEIKVRGEWYRDFFLTQEAYRGLKHTENHFYAAELVANLEAGQSLTVVATTETQPTPNSNKAFKECRQHQQQLLQRWKQANQTAAPSPIKQLVLAADQFIVQRSTDKHSQGKTIIAGYPWFTDWGRDTMISLTGLTVATGRLAIARTIILTFAEYLDGGMLPNMFPDENQPPVYNTADATLWYFEAVRAYWQATGDQNLLTTIYPILADIVDWHCRGTRYNIGLDDDGLIYAGESGIQLTWMDGKVGDWVVTPRQGKAVEINALWYNALTVMIGLSQELNKSPTQYQRLAQNTAAGFQRFWYAEGGYCYDVLDTPDGNDASLRPNQIFAVSLPETSQVETPPLLTSQQQKSVVDVVAQNLVTSYGLRSLAPHHSQYRAQYGGDTLARDGAYHQGTVWSWLLGHFVQAHWKVYHNAAIAKTFLTPIQDHLHTAGLGSISEIFDGDSPYYSRGCIAQAWSVAEILRVWRLLHLSDAKGID